MKDQGIGTGMSGQNAANGPSKSSPVSASGSSATTKAVSIDQPKRKGFFHKVLGGLRVAGGTALALGLSILGIGAVEDE